jgi:hypothetical protein
MKRFSKLFFIIIALAVFIPTNSNAQCKTFAKNICKPELDPYIHDGNYNAAILTEGEEAELYKTFYSGQTYRVCICGSEALPNLEFQVIDSDNNVIYDNSKDDYAQIWDFKTEASQQLKIHIKVPSSGKEQEDIKSGCVAIMFGFKEEGY